MKLPYFKERWQRRAARTFIGVLAGVLVLGFFLNLYFSPILARTVRNTVLKASDSLYHIEFSDASLDVIQGKIVVRNINLRIDSVIYKKRVKQSNAPNNLYRLYVKKLVLKHIHPFRLYFTHKLDLGELIVTAPEIDLQYERNHKVDRKKKNQTLYQQISKSLKYVHINKIALNDINFKYQDYSGNRVAISEVKEMNITATDLLIDSATQTDKSRFLYCKDVVTEINNFNGRTTTGLYTYRMKYLRLSTKTSKVNINGLTVKPIGPDSFFDKSKHDRFGLQLDSVEMENFDFLNYHKYRTFSTTSMTIKGGRLDVFSNYKGKKKTDDRYSTFPNYGIYKLKTDLKIDTIKLKDFDVTYTELSKTSQRTGTVRFMHTYGKIINLTTNAAALKKNPDCRVVLDTRFMNRANLNTTFTFNLADTVRLPYSYSGHLATTNLQWVNAVTMPMAMVKINSGTAKSLDFNVRANRYNSKGQVTLLYNDLKITLLKPDTAQNKLKRMTLMSFFANALIIKHNNPDNPNTPPRTYLLNEKRPPNFPFFKTVWKNMLLGIRSCAGYGEKREKEVKTQMADHADKKAQRQARRAERKARRAERKAVKAAQKAAKS